MLNVNYSSIILYSRKEKNHPMNNLGTDWFQAQKTSKMYWQFRSIYFLHKRLFMNKIIKLSHFENTRYH